MIGKEIIYYMRIAIKRGDKHVAIGLLSDFLHHKKSTMVCPRCKGYGCFFKPHPLLEIAPIDWTPKEDKIRICTRCHGRKLIEILRLE